MILAGEGVALDVKSEFEKMTEHIKYIMKQYIYMYIRGASNFILKCIGRCGKMKTNDYSAEHI